MGVLEASWRLRVARGTVQARLERMTERGVITGYGPEVDPAALGYEATAFITLEIHQAGGHDPVAGRLAARPGRPGTGTGERERSVGYCPEREILQLSRC